MGPCEGRTQREQQKEPWKYSLQRTAHADVRPKAKYQHFQCNKAQHHIHDVAGREEFAYRRLKRRAH